MTELQKTPKEFDVEFVPLYEMFYSDESNYGVFEVDVVSNDDHANVIKKMMGKQSIIVVGNTTRLERHRKYCAKLTITSHKKYGKQFKIMTIYEKTPTSKDEQKTYLSTLLTPLQVENLWAVYGEEENIIELIIENKIDHTKVHGLGETTLKKVRNKVEENMLYAKALVELTSKFALTVNVIKKLVDHYGSADVLLARIYENPYELAEKVSGIGFVKADEIAQNAGISKESPNRILACAKHILKQSGSTGGHCFLIKKQLIISMYELLRLKKDRIVEIFDANVESDYELVVEDKKIGLASIYHAEKGIVNCLSDLISYSQYVEVENFEGKLAQVEIEQGFSFTDEQRLAIETACRSNVIFVSGKAGTGKTSVMKGILKILLDSSDGLLYETCAFSGKASQRIKESTGYNSKTIHRMLGYGKNEDGSSMFKFHAYNPLDADIIVLDEASMVNSKILFSLVSAIKSGAKFICLGDHAQLEPIGEGFAFGDLLKSKKFPTVELTIVQRQALKSGVLSTANKVREGKNFMIGLDDSKPQKLGDLKDLLFCPYNDRVKLEKTLLRLCKEYKGDILDFQVIVPTRKRGDLCSNNLNIKLQDIFNPVNENTRKLNYNGIEYREKDKIITKGNDYEKSVFNGTLGIIAYIDEVAKVATIKFEDGATHDYEYKDFEKIDLGYALTIHRCQGSQFKFCVVAVENSAWTMLSQQLLYTALTRTIKNCILFGQIDALEQCIRSNKSVNRQTYLPYFLKEVPKYEVAREA
jgi:RecD/TraA family predicted helicase